MAKEQNRPHEYLNQKVRKEQRASEIARRDGIKESLLALAEVDNPTDAIHALDRLTTRKQIAPKRSATAFNPVARDETLIFRALLSGEPAIRGFSNPDIRNKLTDTVSSPKSLIPAAGDSHVTAAVRCPLPFNCATSSFRSLI
jgi:hypothetical protein